jgi:hypothetical protein
MSGKNVLVSLTVSRDKDEIVYKLDCNSDLLNEELEYYLQEIIKGICTWKPGVCSESTLMMSGTIKKRSKKK